MLIIEDTKLEHLQIKLGANNLFQIWYSFQLPNKSVSQKSDNQKLPLMSSESHKSDCPRSGSTTTTKMTWNNQRI